MLVGYSSTAAMRRSSAYFRSKVLSFSRVNSETELIAQCLMILSTVTFDAFCGPFLGTARTTRPSLPSSIFLRSRDFALASAGNGGHDLEDMVEIGVWDEALRCARRYSSLQAQTDGRSAVSDPIT